tara:strand:+ start:495 stop:650 length:156 start_codon:yes stop_codon:yes gene_type:complete
LEVVRATEQPIENNEVVFIVSMRIKIVVVIVSASMKSVKVKWVILSISIMK